MDNNCVKPRRAASGSERHWGIEHEGALGAGRRVKSPRSSKGRARSQEGARRPQHRTSAVSGKGSTRNTLTRA